MPCVEHEGVNENMNQEEVDEFISFSQSPY